MSRIKNNNEDLSLQKTLYPFQTSPSSDSFLRRTGEGGVQAPRAILEPRLRHGLARIVVGSSYIAATSFGTARNAWGNSTCLAISVGSSSTAVTGIKSTWQTSIRLWTSLKERRSTLTAMGDTLRELFVHEAHVEIRRWQSCWKQPSNLLSTTTSPFFFLNICVVDDKVKIAWPHRFAAFVRDSLHSSSLH